MNNDLTITSVDLAIAVIEEFNGAWNAKDIDAAMSLMTEDCLFENTSPAPDGERFVGQAAVRQVWESLFRTPGMRFETEELFARGDRVTALWRYSWRNDNGSAGHIRGIDVFLMREGKIAEKRSYVKG